MSVPIQTGEMQRQGQNASSSFCKIVNDIPPQTGSFFLRKALKLNIMQAYLSPKRKGGRIEDKGLDVNERWKHTNPAHADAQTECAIGHPTRGSHI